VKLELVIYRSTVDGPSTPEEKLEEGNLSELYSVFSKREHLGARTDTFSGPSRLLQLEVQPGTARLMITLQNTLTLNFNCKGVR
jgi:hypothetical protein